MPQTIEESILARVYGHGRGWAFSPKDFVDLGGRNTVDSALSRHADSGTIRRVIRGIYDYPRFSKLLDQPLGPDIHQVALCLARKFGWQIQPGPAAALNLIGLSTQVPSQYVYLSNGPEREYLIDKTLLTFEHTTLKEAAFRLEETATIVQAIKAIGEKGITPSVIKSLREWLPADKRSHVLKDAKHITDWIYAVVKQVCSESDHG